MLLKKKVRAVKKNEMTILCATFGNIVQIASIDTNMTWNFMVVRSNTGVPREKPQGGGVSFLARLN